MATNNSVPRPITLTLSDRHIRRMNETHLLKENEVNDLAKVAKVAQRLFDRALGLPEDSCHEWDDWAKGLE